MSEPRQQTSFMQTTIFVPEPGKKATRLSQLPNFDTTGEGFIRAGISEFVDKLCDVLDNLPNVPRLTGKFVIRVFNETTTEVCFKSSGAMSDGSPNPLNLIKHAMAWLYCNRSKQWFTLPVGTVHVSRRPSTRGCDTATREANLLETMRRVISGSQEFRLLLDAFPKIPHTSKEIHYYGIFAQTRLLLYIQEGVTAACEISAFVPPEWTLHYHMDNDPDTRKQAAARFANLVEPVTFVEGEPPSNRCLMFVPKLSTQDLEAAFKNHPLPTTEGENVQ